MKRASRAFHFAGCIIRRFKPTPKRSHLNIASIGIAGTFRRLMNRHAKRRTASFLPRHKALVIACLSNCRHWAPRCPASMNAIWKIRTPHRPIGMCWIVCHLSIPSSVCGVWTVHPRFLPIGRTCACYFWCRHWPTINAPAISFCSRARRGTSILKPRPPKQPYGAWGASSPMSIRTCIPG